MRKKVESLLLSEEPPKLGSTKTGIHYSTQKQVVPLSNMIFWILMTLNIVSFLNEDPKTARPAIVSVSLTVNKQSLCLCQPNIQVVK
jgi:hypothetical protein